MVYKSQDKCNLLIWRFNWMTTLCTDYMEHIDDGSVQIIHFQVFIGTCRLFYFAFYGWTSNIDALTNYSMLSETRATRSIYHVYSVYWVTAQYSEASHEWQEVPIHQGNVTTCHIGIKCLTTTFVWLCWCKLRHLGDWIFTLHWSANTNSYSCPLIWVTKCHVECGNNLLH